MIEICDGVSTHGTECPKCGNSSVFKEEIYVGWFVFKIHKYDLYKCQMYDCDFIKKEEI